MLGMLMTATNRVGGEEGGRRGRKMAELNRNWNQTPDQYQDLYPSPDWIPMNLPPIILPNPCRYCRCLV